MNELMIKKTKKISDTKKNGKRRGFTLIELVIVVAIIGILALIAIPQFNNVTKDAREKTFEANFQNLVSAIAMYQAGNNGEMPDDNYNFDSEINGGLSSLQDAPKGATYVYAGDKLTATYSDHRDTNKQTLTYPKEAATPTP